MNIKDKYKEFLNGKWWNDYNQKFDELMKETNTQCNRSSMVERYPEEVSVRGSSPLDCTTVDEESSINRAY